MVELISHQINVITSLCALCLNGWGIKEKKKYWIHIHLDFSHPVVTLHKKKEPNGSRETTALPSVICRASDWILSPWRQRVNLTCHRDPGFLSFSSVCFTLSLLCFIIPVLFLITTREERRGEPSWAFVLLSSKQCLNGMQDEEEVGERGRNERRKRRR